MSLRFQRYPSPRPGGAMAARVAAVVLALLTAVALMAAAGNDPIALGQRVVRNTFGSRFGMEDLGLLLTPLIYTGLAVAVALRIGAWNIGAVGQFKLGAFCAAGVGPFVPGPPAVILPAMIMAGAIGGGALWVLVPTLARVYANMSELITTLLLNFVASLLVYWVATGPRLDPSGLALATTARMPVRVPEVWGIVHWGLPVAVTGIAAVVAWPVPVFGLAMALLVGLGFGVLFALAVVVVRANQVLCGLALTLIGTGLAATLGKAMRARRRRRCSSRS